MSSPVQKRKTRRLHEPPLRIFEMFQPWTRPAELAKYATPFRNATEFSIEKCRSGATASRPGSQLGTVSLISGRTRTFPLRVQPRFSLTT